MRQEGELVDGRFRLERVLGRGGMGRVWLAEDERLGRRVALKELLFLHGTGEEGARRFDREARALARMRHDAVVAVHDLLSHLDPPAIVMEYVDGASLRDVLRTSGKLPLPEAARLGLAVLGALREAHGKDVVHRDLKPANILVAGPRVVVTDFGVALLGDMSQMTGLGGTPGTSLYMAPEQLEHDRGSAASDLWSLGAVLWEAVEGRQPFGRTSQAAVVRAICDEEPPEAEHAGALADVIRGLLVKDPAARMTAEEVAAALDEASAALDEPPLRALERPAPAPRAGWGPPPGTGRPPAPDSGRRQTDPADAPDPGPAPTGGTLAPAPSPVSAGWSPGPPPVPAGRGEAFGPPPRHPAPAAAGPADTVHTEVPPPAASALFTGPPPPRTDTPASGSLLRGYLHGNAAALFLSSDVSDFLRRFNARGSKQRRADGDPVGPPPEPSSPDAPPAADEPPPEPSPAPPASGVRPGWGAPALPPEQSPPKSPSPDAPPAADGPPPEPSPAPLASGVRPGWGAPALPPSGAVTPPLSAPVRELLGFCTTSTCPDERALLLALTKAARSLTPPQIAEAVSALRVFGGRAREAKTLLLQAGQWLPTDEVILLSDHLRGEHRHDEADLVMVAAARLRGTAALHALLTALGGPRGQRRSEAWLTHSRRDTQVVRRAAGSRLPDQRAPERTAPPADPPATPATAAPRTDGTAPGPAPLPSAIDPPFTLYWFAVPVVRRVVVADLRPRVVADLRPGVWYLAVGQRGQALVVRLEDGRHGLLHDTSDLQRG
ncbi:serine/threonine-protein kinase [Streptomyces genisteinicus]|uniref:non-specific serine/threonine protein kinase n=1 Tax=Streptomyces genisteinicus TaxID=2768068 RepID=A0A7H0HRJ9_9ACTN|nr:serine/threonine-protein kinase [Streptomyces genisteinicus]QNP63165.1 protein kinase [Streptomyces genisteinicus]